MERLAETTHLSLTMYRFDDEQMPPDFQEARFSLWEGESLLVRPLSEQLIAGYALLRDIYGKPAFLLRADIPRAIYRQGQASMRYLLLSLLAVGLVFGVTALLLLERLVLSRLARLSTDVSNISASSAFSGRVFMTGKDELSSLAGTINEMLQALEHSQHELRRAYDELEMRVQERTAELSELYDLSRALADAVHDFDTILDLITRRAVETIHITFPKRFAWPAASAIRPPVHCTAPNSSSNWHTPTCKPCSPWPTPWMPKTPTPPITPSDWQPWPWR
jgi:methyl-accepting chemotaxis protein